MPENQAILLGKVVGSLEGLTKATEKNTAEIKIFNEYMHLTRGAEMEKQKTEAKERAKTKIISISGGGIFGMVMAFIGKYI